MSRFLDLLHEWDIDIDPRNEKRVPIGKNLQKFFESAFLDILQDKCWIYRDAVEKDVKFHIYAEFPERTINFNINDQIKKYLEDAQ